MAVTLLAVPAVEGDHVLAGCAQALLTERPAPPAFAALPTVGPARTPATPERFYLLANRYRFSSIAPDALIEAADRSSQLGDAFSASTYFAFAINLGYKPDDDHATTL